MTITTIGIDLAKNVFQIHAADDRGVQIFNRSFSRKKMIEFIAKTQPCLIAMEACSSSHYWARKFKKMGHQVKLIAPQFVKPFVKSNKNDSNDAEAIVEAVSRPSMRFVTPKSVEQQDIQSIHRIRQRLIRSRTSLINEIRGLLSEYGVVIKKGPSYVIKGILEAVECSENELSLKGRRLFLILKDELEDLENRIERMDIEVKAVVQENEMVKKLMEVPGVGPLTATALIATVRDAKGFKNGRELSSCVGLVPRQNSSGGKASLGRISKRGDMYLRMLLIHGARSVILRINRRNDAQAEWLKRLIERRGKNKACVALANKNLRVLWKLMVTEERYKCVS